MISLIVAACNIEEYIEQCLESIRNQTVHDLEVIVIEDGSSDGTSDICDSFAEIDSRFKIYHIANQGLAYGRKFGFDKSSGGMICFIDGDDWLEDCYCEKMLKPMLKDNCDIVVCGFYTNQTVSCHWSRLKMVGGGQSLKEYLNGGIYNRMWNKMYKRDIVKGTQFSIGRDLFEDGFWQPQALARANIVLRIPDCLYHYRVREGSLLNRKRSFKSAADYMINSVGRIQVLCENCHVVEKGILRSLYTNEMNSFIEMGYDLDQYGIMEYMRALSRQHTDLLKGNAGSAEMAKAIVECRSAKDLRRRYAKQIKKNGKDTLQWKIKFYFRPIKRWMEQIKIL